ncbi:MAG TPA: putative sulfate exporter family transporter [Terriglobia bacterium]|nr:putative sulfate exporter family transporter [Terriglobia bacterium]
MTAKILFIVGLAGAASSLLSPPIALALGIAFGLAFTHPFPQRARKVSKFLLQASVVGLGFGMDLHAVLRAGRSGFIYTCGSITVALALGLALGKLLGVTGTSSYLISTGTAICGGSAIAAVAPILGANDHEMSVSLGTVFSLNSIALFTFPLIGAALKLTQTQFGLWAALAIHDTSSVVGASVKYGAVALAVATTVKLARALWIVPVSLGTAAVKHRSANIQWPWFILYFCLATVVATYLPAGAPLYSRLSHVAIIGLTVTLYLIGTGISRRTLREVGPRPLLQGVLLWIIVLVGSLELIRHGWIAL